MEIGIGLGLAWANKRNKIWTWVTEHVNYALCLYNSLDMFHMAPDTIPNRKLKELVKLHGLVYNSSDMSSDFLKCLYQIAKSND